MGKRDDKKEEQFTEENFRKGRRGNIRKEKVNKYIIFRTLLIICFGILFFYLCKKCDSLNISKTYIVAGSIIIIYLILFLVINFSENIKLELFVERIEEKEKVNSFLITIFLGILLTVVLTSQSNQIAERQVKIANRETSPAFKIESYQNITDVGYEITNEKGMASYITLNVYESYFFMYKGERYEVNFAFFNEEENGKANMDEENSKLIFLLECQGFDRKKASECIKTYVINKLNDSVVISNEKYIELSFFDYKSERFTFRFGEYKDSIRLLSTGERVSTPSHNVTMFFGGEADLEEQIKTAVDFVIKDNENVK